MCAMIFQIKKLLFSVVMVFLLGRVKSQIILLLIIVSFFTMLRIYVRGYTRLSLYIPRVLEDLLLIATLCLKLVEFETISHI
jgi:hypothetical protein